MSETGSSHPENADASNAINKEPEITPLKKNVTVVGDKRDTKWICNFGCRADTYTGSYSRINARLIGLKKGEKAHGVVLCPALSKVDREKLRKEEEDARDTFGGDLRKRKRAGCFQLPPPGADTNVVKEMFKMSAIDDTDAIIVRFFYTCGIPFNVARSPFWIDAPRALNEASKGYKVPSSEKIRTTLLDKEKTVVDNQLGTINKD